MRQARSFTGVILAMGLALVGCERGTTTQPAGGKAPTLMLFCGAGIQLPVAELCETFSEAYDCRIEADYAGSEVLLSRIKLKRQGDLYMPGDASYVEMAAKEGLIASSTPVCYFVPTLLVQKGNPKKITSLKDLTREGVRVGLGDINACAIGRQCRKIFKKNRIPWPEIAPNVKFQSLTVNELGVQIQAGSLDAVIVWDAVAKQYLRHGEIVEIPTRQNVISTVTIGILTFSDRKDLAEQFVAFAASEAGRAIFTKHDYRVDLPTATTQREQQ